VTVSACTSLLEWLKFAPYTSCQIHPHLVLGKFLLSDETLVSEKGNVIIHYSSDSSDAFSLDKEDISFLSLAISKSLSDYPDTP